ncbi:MAG: hypothetical protein ACRDJE_28420 [Dehalococcoidia bacterium]
MQIRILDCDGLPHCGLKLLLIRRNESDGRQTLRQPYIAWPQSRSEMYGIRTAKAV